MQEEAKRYQSDIKARSYSYALNVIKLIDKMPKDNTSTVMGKQLLRSATSVGANIIEARAASSRRDFTNFLNHALKSANESRFWLGLIRDLGKVTDVEIDHVFKETVEIGNILGASILRLKEKS